MTDRRWAWVEVDQGAITRNVERLAARLPAGGALMAVVKADGYGHGAEAAARAALEGGATTLGVATLAEGVSLRDAGVDAPIHVLSEIPPTAARDALGYRLVPTVARRASAEALARAGEAEGRAAGFHLKVDTGMNRIGVPAEEAAEFLESLRGLPALRLDGVFTHFATAEVRADWDFDRQMERFESAIRAVREAGFDPGTVHAANSGATILHAASHYDLVRCGISIYGLHPGEETKGEIDLEPAMAVKARLAQVKRVGMGDGVSYGLTWRASGPTTIATIPLGYADGLHRVLSGEIDVLVGGKRCRQVGRICMDQCMVELPRGVEAREGDEAVLVGSQGSESILLDELAEAAGTINYELACGFGQRLEHVTI